MKISVHASLVGVLVCVPLANAVAAPMDERAATRYVCKSGVDAALASAQRVQGSAAVTAARVLPNPSLIVQHQAGLSGGAEGETVLGVSVPLSIGGRRGLAQDAGEARRLQTFAEARATLFTAAVDFREAYSLAALDQARAIVFTEQQRALDSLSEVIGGLTRGGETAGYDLLRQETQSALHRRVLESALGQAAASFARLEAWTGKDNALSGVALPNFGEAELRGAADQLGAGNGQELSLQVQALELQAKASDSESKAAARRSIPDVDVFAGYRRTSFGSEIGHGMALSLTLPLTFFDHGQGEVARANGEAGLARTLAIRLRQQQRADLKAVRKRLSFLRTSLIASQETSKNAAVLTNKARQLYASGEVSISELLETYRDAEQARLITLDLGEELARGRFATMRALGTMFEPTLDRVCNAKGTP